MRGPPARQHLLGTRGRVDEDERPVVAVFLEIGPGDTHDDGAPVGVIDVQDLVGIKTVSNGQD